MHLKLSQMVNQKHLEAVLDTAKWDPNSHDGLSVSALGAKILNKEIDHLCVSLDDMHFGQLDFETGEIRVNKIQKDSTDDDLLDDLVELAIDQGIKVSVVPRKYLPRGKIFLAS
jgi:hypothetical protein